MERIQMKENFLIIDCVVIRWDITWDEPPASNSRQLLNTWCRSHESPQICLLMGRSERKRFMNPLHLPGRAQSCHPCAVFEWKRRLRQPDSRLLMLPLIIGLKVPSYYVLVKQQSNTLPSVCVSVNHICSPLLLFQMVSIIALFLLQMFYGTLSEHSQPRVDKALDRLMGK